jgi:glycosyltransferase involved in cell wall biosynthesis
VNTHSLPLQGKLIAFFHQSSDMYGSDKILLYLAEGVNKLGGQAVVMLPDTGPLTRELEQRGIEFHALPMLKVTRARFSFKGMLELAREMRVALPAYDAVLRGRKVDLVHSNTIAVLGGALWARRHRIPHLWHVHEIIEHPWIASHIFPLLLKLFADRVVCNSKATYQWLFSLQPSLKRKMCVIWNGVQVPTRIEESCAEQLHCRFRPEGSRLAVGLIGRINRWKGHGLLLDAVDILHSKGVKDFSVVFMGNSPPGQETFELELKQRIAKSPMRDHIIVQGFSSDVWPAYAALDIVCVPSTEPEPFGLVAVEAMAMDKPVVAARFGGLTEIVVDGATGLTFSPRDANALAAVLETLLCDDEMRARFGHAGKRRFSEKFSVDHMIERFGLIYAEMMGPQG